MQNHLLNYHNQFFAKFYFQKIIKPTHFIFVETLLILDRVLLILILKNYISYKQHLQKLLTLLYKQYLHLGNNQLFLHN